MKLIFIILAIILITLSYIIGVKENLKIAFINEQAIENIKGRNKREVSKKLSSPLIPMAVLLGVFPFMDNFESKLSFSILSIVFMLFIFIEVTNIRKINDEYKNKVTKKSNFKNKKKK
ncbi:MAG: hypothetical protein ACRC7R_12125 [Sarcina sp.]